MRFWFGRKSAAADVRPLLPAWLGTEGTAGFARDYSAQFEEVFRRNPVGQRAVRLVAGTLGALPVYAVEGDERGAAIVSADGLLEGIAANLLLHGNSFVRLITGDDGTPVELCLVRADRQRGEDFGRRKRDVQSATPYHTFVSDAGDTDRPKIAIRDQNASVRVIYYPL